MSDAALNVTFSALADPTRRAILARLAQGDAPVGEIAKPFALSLPTISRHLDVLEAAGLIVRERDAQWRRCRFTPAPLLEAGEWIARYAAFWEGRLDALTRFLANPTAAARKPRRPRKSRKGRS